MSPIIPKRLLGRTGLEVSTIGLGAAVIGDLYENVNEASAIDTVLEALSGGINYIDTSPLYGHGLSEHRLGTALRHRPDTNVILSTKVGRVTDPFSAPDPNSGYFGGAPHAVNFDYSYDGTFRSLEQSLLRLGRDKVDLVLIHDLEPEVHGDAYGIRFKEAIEGTVPALTQLRESGVIRGFGIGVNNADAAEQFAKETDLDAILIAGRYSLLEQPAISSLLPLSVERNIGVILGGVFNSGILATGAVPGARYNYADAPDPVLQKVAKLEAVCQRHGVELRHAALNFVFGHPAVSTVVLGASSHEEVRTQLDDFQHPVPTDLWEELKAEGLLAAEVPTPGAREETGK